MHIATIVLVLAALGGATMVIVRLSGRPHPPTWMALGHGLVALGGVGLLAGACTAHDAPPLACWALGVFGLAAIGGATMFFGFHLKERALPIPLMLAHGLAALTGVGMVIAADVQVRRAEAQPARSAPVETAPAATAPAPTQPASAQPVSSS